MSGLITTFQTAKWQRERVEFPMVQRPCRIEDLKGKRIMVDGDTVELEGNDFLNAMQIPNVWKAANPAWQQALDGFTMQKVDYVITLKKVCSADSIDINTMETEILDKRSLEYFYGEQAAGTIEYTWQDIEAGKDYYIIESLGLEDHKNGTCSVTLKLKSHGQWIPMERDLNVTIIQ